ncbi:5-bromo-4-chloroindolyl phosphate hydrolysis family protein [Tropicimonas sp. S265A]|uniref:5-bromo-4-chloroindolyl phosphate hydrolysis family protein n=1 Tax=Tropicimonas sp. S265A TaxID=3415134 RepID=UPI003C7E7084
MSQRFGGKYSPGAPRTEGQQTPARPAVSTQRTRLGARSNAMFVLPLPLALTAFGKDATGLAVSLAALGIMIFGAFLLREGLKAEEAYDVRKVAKRPAIPRKIFAAALVGLGIGMAVVSNGAGMIGAGLLGAVGAGLHVLAFGLDPLSDKGAEGIDEFQSARVARVVDEAEKYLAEMSDAILRARERPLELAVEQFKTSARALCRQVEEDPRDLAAARKYLGVYLMGARDATVKFADFYAESRNAEAREDYLALLQDLETNFAARREALLLDDRTDLDVEIEVLRDRLAQEGIKTPV